MILSTRGNYTSLEGTRTDPVQAIDPMPYRPHTSSRSTAMPADYTQCRVRKQSNEFESETRIVKSQRSGVALTERGGSWGLDGSCFAAIAAERPLCPHETISIIFFQPFASTGLYQFVRSFRSILEHVSIRSPSQFVRLHGKPYRLFFRAGARMEPHQFGHIFCCTRDRASEASFAFFCYLPPRVGLRLTAWTYFLYARSRT